VTRNSTVLGRFVYGQQPGEFRWLDDTDAFVLLQAQQVSIAAHDDVGVPFDGTGHDPIVVRVRCDAVQLQRPRSVDRLGIIRRIDEVRSS